MPGHRQSILYVGGSVRRLGLAGVVLLAGCASFLPHSENDNSTFKTFADAQHAVASLVPMHSDMETLKTLGIDPLKLANAKLLTHADVVRLFVPSSILEKPDLDLGIVACLEARDHCHGIELNASHITAVRTGNFFADFFNFSRHTKTTGWRFNAVILLMDDVVVYRNWGGQPAVNESDVKTNPLGPLQDMGPSTIPVK